MTDDHNIRLIGAGVVREVHLRQLAKEFQRARGLRVDGILSTPTLQVLERAASEDVTGEIRVSRWGAFSGPLRAIPKTRTDCYETYGNPGTGKLDAKWERQNIVKATIPRPDGPPFTIRIHRLVEPYVREGFRRGFLAAPKERVVKVGGFVFRHERHDVSRPLSKHAFGCACDINAEDNRLIRFGAGHAPEPGSAEWQRHWPAGLSKAFVDAFCSVGFAWGADWDQDGASSDHTDLDPMHFELVDRRAA